MYFGSAPNLPRQFVVKRGIAMAAKRTMHVITPEMNPAAELYSVPNAVMSSLYRYSSHFLLSSFLKYMASLRLQRSTRLFLNHSQSLTSTLKLTHIRLFSLTTSFKMPEAPVTAYNWKIKPQDHTNKHGGSKGLDAEMDPPANWSELEHWTDDGKPYLVEYEGRGLLKDKAALITGGDSGIGR